jgi:hypothetical protein
MAQFYRHFEWFCDFSPARTLGPVLPPLLDPLPLTTIIYPTIPRLA